MKKLVDSAVKFDKRAHTYEYCGHMLSGVTAIVNWMYPRTYDGISEEVLMKAAERGTAVHSMCEMYDTLGIITNDENVSEYIRLTDGLKHIASEYLVSDEVRLASCIDKVYEDADGRCVLADIKTTSQIHEPNVRLQLSIYAWLFEQQTGINVDRIAVIWLPNPEKHYGTACMRYVDRIASEKVYDIVLAYFKGEDPGKYVTDIAPVGDGTLPVDLSSVEVEVVKIEQQMKEMKKRSDELRKGLLELMQQYGVKKWKGEHVTLTRTEATTRQTLDSAKVKSRYPDVYRECVKESKVSESLKITLS